MIKALNKILSRICSPFHSAGKDTLPEQHLENTMLTIRAGYVSITGNFRDNNEDNCVVDPQHRFAIVADGMGGQSAGEKASALAAELIPQRLLQLVDFSGASAETITAASVVEAIDKSIDFANSEIMALSEMNPGFRNMGTTVVLMVLVGNRFFVGGVGDSRAYELRKGTLKQLTTDHSLTQALIEAGTISPEEAKTHRYRNVLYRYLGTRDGSSGSKATQLTPQPGDRFILCSDGVTDGVSDAELNRILQSSSDPQTAAKAIVEAAQAGGSRDNITCAAIFVD